jgi:hypothetical protein
MSNEFAFSDPSVMREHAQWQSAFVSPIPMETKGGFFSNFGSVQEGNGEDTPIESFVDTICESLANEVFQYVRSELGTDGPRPVHASTALGKPTKPITASQPKRTVRPSHTPGTRGRLAGGKGYLGHGKGPS